MGVVNITPDSFYPLSRIEPSKIVDKTIEKSNKPIKRKPIIRLKSIPLFST